MTQRGLETVGNAPKSKGSMKLFLRSIVTAFVISGAVLSCSIFVLAPRLPCVVGRPAVEETRTLTLPVAPNISLSNANGAVLLRTGRPGEIVVVVHIKAYAMGDAPLKEIQDYVKSLIQVTQDEQHLSLTTELEERPDSVDILADYSVQVPDATNVTVDNANGNISILAGCGEVVALGGNSDIEISGPLGKVTAESKNGRIRVLDAPADTTLNTVNGAIYAHMLGGTLHADTTNGLIVARMLKNSVTGCDLTTQNGGITLVMSSSCSAKVDARTAKGRVRSDLSMNCAQGCKNQRHIRGKIGEGQATVTLRALNGNIWIARSD